MLLRYLDFKGSLLSRTRKSIFFYKKSPKSQLLQLETDCNRLGQSQTVGIHQGNTSDTWGSARKSNFRFAAATDDCIFNRLR